MMTACGALPSYRHGGEALDGGECLGEPPGRRCSEAA